MPFSHPIEAVIFDLGGVLVRTEDRAPRAGFAQRLGMTYEQLEAAVFGSSSARQASIGAISAQQHWEIVANQLGIPLDELEAFQSAFWGGDRLDERLVNFLRSQQSTRKTGLLSNAWSDLRMALREQWHIIDAFDEVIISAEVGMVKPDARIFHLAVSRLGVAPHSAVFVDDFIENVHGARQAGLQAIHFENTEQVLQAFDAL